MTWCRKTLGTWAVRFGWWVLGQHWIVLTVPRDELYALAVAMLAEAEWRYPNSQARWHWVYGQLVEAFPERALEVGAVIEAAQR